MKILIVDDSKAMRMIVKRTLRQAGYGDHEFAEAVDGANGYEQVNDWQPDLVLSDWNMPNMSGLEFLQKLKTDGNTVKFGFITSEGTAEMRQMADENGALFLISKPFTSDTVKDTLEKALS
ncbi:MAG: response regulator [Myxococcales bacterium]|nr:response regulator [Myxococcales bacterium]